MADGDLTSAEFDLAFTFSRSEAAIYRNAAGIEQTAPINAARWDHAADGTPLGLLIGAGSDLGHNDRIAIDPLILPATLADFTTVGASDATVLHHFDDGTGAMRRAWYTRNARATIDALLAQQGHHLSIGVIPGLRAPENGYVRYRGEAWVPPPLLVSGNAFVGNGGGQHVIACGAELPANG